MIKFQQSPALTSQFESFWSIVNRKVLDFFNLIAKVGNTDDDDSKIELLISDDEE